MEATGVLYVTNDKILDTWHCPLGVDFAHAVDEIVTSRCHAMFTIRVFVKHRDVQKIFAC
jgi:hypothetical protein